MATTTLATPSEIVPAQTSTRRLPLPVAPAFSLVDERSPERACVESYIADKFARIYSANIRHFMPQLLTLRCKGQISAAVGIRSAADSALFVEHYLDTSVENVLARSVGSSVERAHIIEIGNLVSTWRGSSQLLFIALTELVCQLGCEWTIFTATPEVRKLLKRLDLQQYLLCHADGSRLGEQLKDWGSYYQTQPAVTAVNALAARQALQSRRLTRELLTSCSPLIQQLVNGEQTYALPA